MMGRRVNGEGERGRGGGEREEGQARGRQKAPKEKMTWRKKRKRRRGVERRRNSKTPINSDKTPRQVSHAPAGGRTKLSSACLGRSLFSFWFLEGRRIKQEKGRRKKSRHFTGTPTMTRDPRACDHERRGGEQRGGNWDLLENDRSEGGREEGREGK